MQTPILSAYFAALKRDLLLVMRRKTEVLTALFFFVSACNKGASCGD